MTDARELKTVPEHTRHAAPAVAQASVVPESDAEEVSDPTPPVIAGYELVRVIGRGGMGVVWEAHEHRLERTVAVKVHRRSMTAEVGANIWSEARLAASVADPGVVAVHDLGMTLDGRPYYTMDLIPGTDLSALLREGALPQARALTIAAQIARAVAAAHERGIAHRDLKPANILIDEQGRARVLDFGLALGSRGDDRFEKVVFGTPSYMSPEQVLADPVGPPADIHAIGIILYEMLTGARPYTGASTDEVMGAIVAAVPDAPTTKNAAIHADVERLVLHCLEKEPSSRIAPARKLASQLEALLEGRPLESLAPAAGPRRTIPAPPVVNRLARRDAAPIHERWVWRLESSSERLWPLVANTERVNRAIGLPEVEFVDTPDGEGASLRTGRMRVMGMEMAWREHPFEWTKGREHSVFRDYARGPLEAMWNRVRLTPLAGGGTELVHEVWMIPRHVLGRLAASWELSQRVGKNLDVIYKKLDAAVTLTDSVRSDAFEPPFEPTGTQRRIAERAGQELVQQGFDSSTVNDVVDYLLYQPTKVLERIHPYTLADLWSIDRTELLTLFLHAVNRGLVELGWDLVCPRCLVSHESFTALAKVERVGACQPCSREYERDLRDSVELVFRPHPALREAVPTTYCAGSPALRPHVHLQQVLTPNEERSVMIDLAPGDYRVVASRVLSPFAFSASGAAFLSELDVVVEHGTVDARPGVVRTGPLTVNLVNTTAHEQVVRIEVATGMDDRVTAADVLTLPEFRDLFSDEMLADGEHMAVSHMAFLFAELVDRASILLDQGDSAAWGVAKKLDAILEEETRAHRGTRVPASLDAQVAAFNTTEDAVRASLAVIRRASELGHPVRAAVHEGQCIALSRVGRTEYFGKTLHRGMSLLADAKAGGVVLSAAVASRKAVVETLVEAHVTQEIATSADGQYKGARVIRVGPPGIPETERAPQA